MRRSMPRATGSSAISTAAWRPGSPQRKTDRGQSRQIVAAPLGREAGDRDRRVANRLNVHPFVEAMDLLRLRSVAEGGDAVIKAVEAAIVQPRAGPVLQSRAGDRRMGVAQHRDRRL